MPSSNKILFVFQPKHNEKDNCKSYSIKDQEMVDTEEAI